MRNHTKRTAAGLGAALSLVLLSACATRGATNSIHAVDVETGKVWKSAELDVTPNELSGVTGGEPHTHEAH